MLFLSFVVSQDRNKAIHDPHTDTLSRYQFLQHTSIRPNAKTASLKDFLSINPSIVGMFSFLIIFVNKNLKADSLASACARALSSQCRWASPVRAAGAHDCHRCCRFDATTRATARARTSPCFAPRRTGRRAGCVQ